MDRAKLIIRTLNSINVFHTQIQEISFTEITQELMLIACAMLFWLLRADTGRAGFNTLAGGFFACLLMRELDGLSTPSVTAPRVGPSWPLRWPA